MAITYTRQQATATAAAGGTSISANTTADLVPGQCIVCWVGAGGAVTLSSMLAVTGITWIAGSGSTGAAATVITTNFNAASNASVGLAVGIVTSLVTSGTTITANYSASDTRRSIVIDEFGGVNTTTPVQTGAGSNVASGAAGSDAAPSITTTGAGLLLVSCNVMNSATVTMSPPTSPATFTETSDIPFTSKNITTAYLLAASAGTYSPTHTVTTGTRAAAEGGASALNPAPLIVATMFDELTVAPLTTGPWTAGPIMFDEAREELIFIAASGAAKTDNENDSVTMSDALVFDRGLALADSVTMSDALAFQFSVTVTDSVTMSDSVAFDRQILIADSVTMSDGIAAERGIQQAINDSVTMSDGTTQESGKGASINDSVTMSDAQTFDRGLALTDSVTMSDSQAFQRAISPADSVTMSDAVAFQRALNPSDSVTMSDAQAFTRGLVVTDTVTMSDFADPVKTTAGGAPPPITVRTYLVGASGRTRTFSGLSATDATGSSGILGVTGSSGATHATGTSGQTGAS